MRLSNETLKKVQVAAATLGDKLRLCGVRPYYAYVDGQRTDTLLGYSYIVTCSGFAGERLAVKVPGKQLLSEADCDKLVRFNGLHIGIYCGYEPGKQGIQSVNLKAEADGASVVNG